jgi:hypothetical protein
MKMTRRIFLRSAGASGSAAIVVGSSCSCSFCLIVSLASSSTHTHTHGVQETQPTSSTQTTDEKVFAHKKASSTHTIWRREGQSRAERKARSTRVRNNKASYTTREARADRSILKAGNVPDAQSESGPPSICPFGPMPFPFTEIMSLHMPDLA